MQEQSHTSSVGGGPAEAPDCSGAAALLSLRDVSRGVKDGARKRRVLDRVSCDIGVKEAVGLLGARRSGKTTLLRIIAGLDVPDEGTVWWDGACLAGMGNDQLARLRRVDGVALLKGDWRAWESLPVVEYLALALYSAGLRMDEAHGCVRQALEEVGAPHLGHCVVSQLGVSDRLYVGLAHALIHRPRLLLVDEPAVLRGTSESERFYLLLHRVCADRGAALLIASEEASALAGVARMLHLSNGTIFSTQPRDNVVSLRSRPAVS